MMIESIPMISIIVPIYNAENFLRKCLDSVLSQTMSNFELICVNDGSTDKSSKILDEYEKKDERIRIVTKPNGGLVSARKAGVGAATGKYIGFVDADDWIEPKMYERLYTAAIENDADLVTSGYVQEGNYTSVSCDNVKEGVYSEEMIPSLRENAIFNLEKRDKGIIASLCTKIFDANIMKRIIVNIPENITMSEDKVTSLTFLLNCRRAVVLHEAYYHYVMHNQSMTHSEDSEYLIHLNQVFQYLKSLYSHPKFTKTMRVQAELYITQFLIKGINSYLGFLNPNLLWIDSYWLNSITPNSKIALYGAGKLGEKYLQQLKAKGIYHFVGFVDFACERNKNGKNEIFSPEKLSDFDYDFVIITIKNQKYAEEVKDRLINISVPSEKILWFRQDEIFWRFAEADGLLE